MCDAKWLFENHRWLKAQVKLLRAEVKRQLKASTSAKDEAISAMTLARPELARPISRKSQSSITEHAALHWQEHAVPASDESESLQRLLDEYESYLQLYDALLTLLTEKEVWFVRQYYEKKIPIAQICVLPDNPFSSCCRSTFCRYREKILKKADAFIYANRMKGDQTCLPTRSENSSEG